MCGLAGYINFDGKPEHSNKIMLDMLQRQRHRGPDDTGIVAINTQSPELWPIETSREMSLPSDANCLLGFNRLSILDTSEKGHQPMTSADHKVVILLNGEIYNAFDFTDELKQRGFTFKSRTDTEVVLYLYLAYGFDAMVKKLNGMFAIVLLDLRQGSLFLARDRFGIKPLYILNIPQRLAFSSEIKSFAALPGFKFELEERHLDEFLLFRNLIHRTLYKGIINLTPGEYWHYSFTGEAKKVTYYDITVDGGSSISANRDADFGESLERAVKRQMISDVKLGCQLSGGVDSSMVSYFAAKALSRGNLETISITFDNARFTEGPYIDYVADKLNLTAHKFALTPSYYIDQLEKATWYFENPLNHPNTIGIYLLSSEAKKYVTVLLSGEGADEVLAGYERFLWQEAGVLSKQFLIKLRQNRQSLPHFLSYYFNDDLRMVVSSSFTTISTAQKLFPIFDFDNAIAARLEIARSLSGFGITRHRKYEMLTYLPDLLMRQDKMSMAHSIENRVPFLDNELVSMALNLGKDALINRYNGRPEGKFILKQLCAEIFTKDFAYRPKMGFGIPLKEFMQEKSFIERLNDRWLPGIKQRGLFSSKTVTTWSLVIDKLSAAELDGLWQMVGFEIWAEQYLDN